jgi:hypothetical protein
LAGVGTLLRAHEAGREREKKAERSRYALRARAIRPRRAAWDEAIPSPFGQSTSPGFIAFF